MTAHIVKYQAVKRVVARDPLERRDYVRYRCSCGHIGMTWYEDDGFGAGFDHAKKAFYKHAEGAMHEDRPPPLPPVAVWGENPAPGSSTRPMVAPPMPASGLDAALKLLSDLYRVSDGRHLSRKKRYAATAAMQAVLQTLQYLGYGTEAQEALDSIERDRSWFPGMWFARHRTRSEFVRGLR